jgi:peptidoglycan/LPS O-acetylase OafA/YrhL
MRFWVGRNLCFMTFIWVGVALHMLYRGFWKRSTFIAVASYVCLVFFFTLHHGPFQHPYLPDDQATTFFNSFMVGLGIFLILYVIGDRIPKNQPMQTLGDMSYPVYLTVTVIGWTVLIWLTNALGYLWALPFAAAATLLIAFLLHKLVEKPTYALAQRITAKPRFRSTSSWSEPARPRRRRREPGAPGAIPAERPVPAPAPAPVGVTVPTSEGNGQTPDGTVGAAEPEPTT